MPRTLRRVRSARCLDGVAISELRQLFEGDGQFDIESILTGELLPKADIRRDTRDRLKKILFGRSRRLSRARACPDRSRRGARATKKRMTEAAKNLLGRWRGAHPAHF